MSLFGLPDLMHNIPPEIPSFLTPGLKWSDETGKVFDIEDETA